jgi:hypothetical protein
VIFGAGVAGFGAGAGLGAGAGVVFGAVLGRVIVGNCGPGFCHGSILGAGVPGFNGSTFGVAGAVLGATLGAVLVAAKASSHADLVPVTNSLVRGSTFEAMSSAAFGAAFLTTSFATAGAAFLTTSFAIVGAATRAAVPRAASAIGISGSGMTTSYPYCVFDDSKCQLIVRKHCIFHRLVLDRQTAQCVYS